MVILWISESRIIEKGENLLLYDLNGFRSLIWFEACKFGVQSSVHSADIRIYVHPTIVWIQ